MRASVLGIGVGRAAASRFVATHSAVPGHACIAPGIGVLARHWPVMGRTDDQVKIRGIA